MITAIIVNHNAGELLPRCIKSLQASKIERVETIVVDNASSDRSVALVRDRFSDVEILQLPENRGFAYGNNLAAEKAAGEFLLLINPDAWLADVSLRRMQVKMLTDDNIGLVAPRLFYPNGNPQFSWSPDRSIIGESLERIRNLTEEWKVAHDPIEKILRRLFRQGWYCAACWLIRKSAFQEIGGFDERFFLYFEDVDFCIRLRQAGWKMISEPLANVFHLGGGSSSGKTSELEYRKSQLAYYRKHRPPWEFKMLRYYLKKKYRRLRRESDQCAEICRLVESAEQDLRGKNIG